MLDIDYSDFKNSTAHGTIAHGFKIYGTSPYCYWCTDFYIKNNFILNFSFKNKALRILTEARDGQRETKTD